MRHSIEQLNARIGARDGRYTLILGNLEFLPDKVRVFGPYDTRIFLSEDAAEQLGEQAINEGWAESWHIMEVDQRPLSTNP